MTEGFSVEQGLDGGADEREANPALLASLRSLADQFGGSLGVALAAAELAGSEVLVQRLTETPQPPADQESPLPEGIYGRIEIPGMRSDTGWITEGTRGGQTVLVVRDWNGCPLGEYILGPACRLVHLPTPLKRPDPQERAAITSGAGGSDDYLWDRETF